MCKCKTEIEAKLTERFRSAEPKATGHRAELMGYAIGLSDSLGMFLTGYMPINLTADFPIKGGTLHKQRTKKQNMHFNFCPFCGEPVKKGA